MSKQKIKVKKSVSKRFKVTKKGKVLRGSQMHGHLRSKKSKSAIRRHKLGGVVEGTFAKKIKKMLAVG